MKTALMALAVVRYDTINIEGEPVRVQEIGTLEFAQYGALASDRLNAKGEVLEKGSKLKATAFLISSCVVDDEGALLLSEEEALTLAKSARVAMPIVNRVMELSGFKEAEEKHAIAS